MRDLGSVYLLFRLSTRRTALTDAEDVYWHRGTAGATAGARALQKEALIQAANAAPGARIYSSSALHLPLLSWAKRAMWRLGEGDLC